MPHTINPPEHCTESGANRLAARLKGVWYDSGYDVTTWIEPVKVTIHQSAIKDGWYAVRSDMVNGQPQRRIDA